MSPYRLAVLFLAASCVAAQEIPLEATDSPLAGVTGPLVFERGQSPTLRFRWVSQERREVTLSGRRLGSQAWLFVDSSPAPEQGGLVQSLTDTPTREARRLGVVTASKLNLRAGPGTQHAIGRTAPRGEELVVVGQRGDWLRLDDAGTTRWAHGRYVKATGGFAPGARSITLRQVEGDFEATVRRGREVVARQTLLDARTPVLLVAVEDQAGFRHSLRGLDAYYDERGYRVERVVEGTGTGLIERLKRATQRPYARVVISTHSGWDGPIWDDGQIAYEDAGFTELAAAFAAGTTRDAKVYVSGCHAGGSNRYETPSPKIWVRDLARLSGRVVAGPTGSTSAAEHTGRQTLAALEGEGTVIQETVLATPTEVVRWGGGLERTTIPNEAPPPSPPSGIVDIESLLRMRSSITVVAPAPRIDFQLAPLPELLDAPELIVDPPELELQPIERPTIPDPSTLIPGEDD